MQTEGVHDGFMYTSESDAIVAHVVAIVMVSIDVIVTLLQQTATGVSDSVYSAGSIEMLLNTQR